MVPEDTPAVRLQTLATGGRHPHQGLCTVNSYKVCKCLVSCTGDADVAPLKRQRLPLQVKSGKEFLKDYYLKHRTLNERDLDDLVTKSSMSYEQVRDWFSRTTGRAEEGKELFSEEDMEGEEEEEEGAGEHADSEGDMEVKEQREEATDNDCNRGEEEGEKMQEEIQSAEEQT